MTATRSCEIDENLARAELTPAQTAEHTARRKELWERKAAGTTRSTSLKDGRSAGPQHARGFAAETAQSIGRSKQDINRAVARGEKIAPDVLKAVQGTKLDTGTALDRLARLPVQEQRKAVKQARLLLDKPPRRGVVRRPHQAARKSRLPANLSSVSFSLATICRAAVGGRK